jgi:Leucine-rich repeat (LRR) protein
MARIPRQVLAQQLRRQVGNSPLVQSLLSPSSSTHLDREGLERVEARVGAVSQREQAALQRIYARLQAPDLFTLDPDDLAAAPPAPVRPSALREPLRPDPLAEITRKALLSARTGHDAVAALRGLGEEVLGQVTALDFSSMIDLPDGFAELCELLRQACPKLESLVLGNTHLVDEDCPSIAELKGLKRLDLAVNRGIGAAGIRSLAPLKDLTSLRVAYCNLDREAMGALTELPALDDLDLSGNDLRNGVGAELEKLPRLTRLKAPGVFADRTTTAAIGTLTDLVELDLWGNHTLDNEAAEQLAPLSKLESLNAGQCSFSGEAVQSWGGMAGLRKLNLTSVWKDGAKAVEALPQFPLLEELDLARMGLKPGDLAPLEKLKRLVRADVQVNKLSRDDVEAITASRDLVELGMRGCELDDDAVEPVAVLHKLEKLDLTHNENLGPEAGTTAGSLPRLEELQLNGCRRFGAEGMKNLAAAGALLLKRLNIEQTLPGAEGMAAAATLPQLRELIASTNRLGDDGLEAATGLASRLEVLDVTQNDLGDRGALALRDFEKLRSLRIGWNQVGTAGAQALAKLEHLHRLDIKYCPVGVEGEEALRRVQSRFDYLDIADTAPRPPPPPPPAPPTPVEQAVNVVRSVANVFGVNF